MTPAEQRDAVVTELSAAIDLAVAKARASRAINFAPSGQYQADRLLARAAQWATILGTLDA